MKSCPICKRTYSDETFRFCLDDGAVLSSPDDPEATLQMQVSSVTKRAASSKAVWNGEVYVNFNTDRNSRHWEDAIRYNFLSGGGSSRNRLAMQSLKPGDRVWVNIAGHGFVGVGCVLQEAQPASRFRVRVRDGRELPILEAPTGGDYRRQWADNSERCEYFVPIRWLDAVTLEKAIQGKGFFGNQNTVCRPKSSLWSLTIEHLKVKFPNFAAR